MEKQNEVKIEKDYPNSAIVYDSLFEEAKEVLESNGYDIISLEDYAKLIITRGKNYNTCKYGNLTREALIYLPNDNIYLTKNSPIMQDPINATEAHVSGNEYFLNDEQVNQSLQDSIRIPEYDIPTDRFKEIELTIFAFGDVAEDYGKWLRNECGIKQVQIPFDTFPYSPFARPMLVRGLNDTRFGFISGDLRGIDNGLRGMKRINLVNQKNLEAILNRVNKTKERDNFSQKFLLLQELNKMIEHFASKEKYEEAFKLQIERDNLYKELR